MINEKLSSLLLGPYAVYVWPCYLLFILALGWHFLWARKAHLDILKKIQIMQLQESEHD